MLGTTQKQSLVDSGLPCLLLFLALVALAVLVLPSVVPVGVADPAVDLEVQAAVLAAVVLLLLEEVVGPDWIAAEVVAGAADSLSLLLAWPPLSVLVLL